MSESILPQSLRDLANKLGYTPGEFLVRRMMQTRAQIEEWQEYLDSDTNHPDFEGLPLGVLKENIIRESAAFAKDELGMLEYFYPKQRSTEIKGPNGGAIPVSVIERVIVDPKNSDA